MKKKTGKILHIETLKAFDFGEGFQQRRGNAFLQLNRMKVGSTYRHFLHLTIDVRGYDKVEGVKQYYSVDRLDVQIPLWAFVAFSKKLIAKVGRITFPPKSRRQCSVIDAEVLDDEVV